MDSIAGQHRRHQHRDQRRRHDDIGDVGGHRDRAAHAVRAHQDARDENGGRHDGERIQLGQHRDDDAGVTVARRHVERYIAGAPRDLDAAGEPRQRARQERGPDDDGLHRHARECSGARVGADGAPRTMVVGEREVCIVYYQKTYMLACCVIFPLIFPVCCDNISDCRIIRARKMIRLYFILLKFICLN